MAPLGCSAALNQESGRWHRQEWKPLPWTCSGAPAGGEGYGQRAAGWLTGVSLPQSQGPGTPQPRLLGRGSGRQGWSPPTLPTTGYGPHTPLLDQSQLRFPGPLQREPGLAWHGDGGVRPFSASRRTGHPGTPSSRIMCTDADSCLWLHLNHEGQTCPRFSTQAIRRLGQQSSWLLSPVFRHYMPGAPLGVCDK